MIVVMMVGILVRVAVPRVNINKYRADDAARTVRGAMQQAQRLSVQRQYDVVVVFDTDNQGVEIFEDNNNNHVADDGERLLWKALEDKTRFAPPPVTLSNGPSGDVTGGSIYQINGYPAVIFHRDGAPNTDLKVYVTSGAGANNDWRAIELQPATGRTDWYRLYSSTWKTAGL
jgi:type II secretory pathway pseudopilin PulG